MATKAKTISARAIAIAAIGSLALGGAQVVAPAGSVLAAGVSGASAQTATPIPADAVKFLGVFGPDGKPLSGLVDVRGDNGFRTDANMVARITVDSAKVDPGASIEVFFAANSNAYSGGAIAVNDTNSNIGFGGTDDVFNVRNVQMNQDGAVPAFGVRITGLPNAAEVNSGKATIDVPIRIGDFTTEGGDGAVQKDNGYDVTRTDQPVKTWTRDTTTGALSQQTPDPNGLRATWTQHVTGSQDLNNIYQTWLNPSTKPDTIAFSVSHRTAAVGAGGDGNVSTLFKPKTDYTPWVLSSPDNWKVVFNGLIATGGAPEATQAQRDAVKVTATPEDGGIRVNVSGVPEGYRAAYTIYNVGYTDPANTAEYAIGVVETKPKATSYDSGARIGGIKDADGNAIKANRVPTAEIRVNNRVTTSDTPVSVTPGKEQTFQIVLGNNGNTSLSNPNVTDPSGKTVTLTDVSIAPGQSKTVDVKYTPKAGDDSATWVVQYSNADPVDATAWIKTGPASGDVTVNPDGTVTIQTPDGPVTLAPKDAVDELEKDLKDANDKVADLQKQLDDEKKKSDADRNRIAELEKELEKAKTDLANTKDALKVAQDAAQDSANNAQETANQALKDLAKERERVDDLTKRADKAEKDLKDARERVAALEKENDAQQKQIDQARKDVKDLQDKTKKLRADLTEAEKRVSTLEAENKKQQDQIDALVKENKTQQSQIDALKKQNGEQQKQIDGLKAGLRDANKKITALETDLALTKIELAEVSGRLAEVEGRLNTGLGKCVGTIGGSLAALVPAVILASQFTGGTNIPQVDNSIAQFQRQLGMFNPQLAQVVDQNRGAIAAGLAGLGLLSLVLLPGTCGDASLGEAAVEPLSSELAARKAARENGEGGSSLKVGANVAAGEGATGSSEK